MIYRFVLLMLISLYISGCGGKKEVKVSGDFSDYNLVPIDGSDAYYAEKRDAAGTLLEDGIVRNNVKDGTWSTYYTDERRNIQTITSYVNGIRNGVYYEFSDRGQLEKREGYLNNQLHGISGVYKFGRPSMVTEYKFGQLDGQHIEYYNSGKIQKLVEFKEGKQHGLFRYYDEEGRITLEYIYDNGEKVSGGIVGDAEESS